VIGNGLIAFVFRLRRYSLLKFGRPPSAKSNAEHSCIAVTRNNCVRCITIVGSELRQGIGCEIDTENVVVECLGAISGPREK